MIRRHVDSDFAADGNPFFTRELVNALVESRALTVDESGSWHLGEDREISWDDLPVTVQQAVETRIEGLPEDLRNTLGLASVLALIRRWR